MEQLLREIEDVLVPELFLAYHENCGGHTICRHVNASVQDLCNRINGQKSHMGSIKKYSRFFGTTEEVLPLIYECLMHNLSTISDWIGNDKPLELLFDFSSPIGDAVVHGTDWHRTFDTSRIIVVLKPAVVRGRLFRIITAYPDFTLDEVDLAWDAKDEWSLRKQSKYAYIHPANSQK